MYDQFTASEQKPLTLKKVNLDPKKLPRKGKKKKILHSKNPYKIKRIPIPGEEKMAQKVLDGFLLLRLIFKTHPKNEVINPHQIIKADISYKRIIDVKVDNLKYFINLKQFNCAQNYIKLEWLKNLTALQTLNLSNNCITQIEQQQIDGYFLNLKILNLSYNKIIFTNITAFSLLSELQDLDLSQNDLSQLPQDLSSLRRLKKFKLGSNKFNSTYKAAYFWGSLASIPTLQSIGIQRNKMRGIHTQMLAAGNFPNLEILDFSYNQVQNQHNLICARNFPSLSQLIVTGNPFAIVGKFKGLQMEVYARTGGQLVNQQIDYFYLKKKKKAKCGIKFDHLVKVQTDKWGKGQKYIFGMQIPPEDQYLDQQQDQQPEQPQIAQEQFQQQKGMFMTENDVIQKKVKPKQFIGSARDNSKVQINDKSNMDHSTFNKVARQVLGGTKQYKTPLDLSTAHRILRNQVKRFEQNLNLQRRQQAQKQKSKVIQK